MLSLTRYGLMSYRRASYSSETGPFHLVNGAAIVDIRFKKANHNPTAYPAGVSNRCGRVSHDREANCLLIALVEYGGQGRMAAGKA